MDRHVAVWAVFLLLAIGIVFIIYLHVWFLKYMERTRRDNLEKANRVLVLVCLLGILVLVAVKIFATNNMFGEILNEASAVGILGFSFFGSIFGACYIARMGLAKRAKKIN